MLDDNNQAQYHLLVGEQQLALNECIGKTLKLTYHHQISCKHCGELTKKSYSQGFCYPCSQKLAQCDMCILKPETCHYAKGTCREPQWGEQHCMIPHFVYLANTSGLKVGITRHTQVPTRWLDQGATQALPIFKVATRLHSGLIETALAQLVADKTNWRTMLKGNGEPIDLAQQAENLYQPIADVLHKLRVQYGSFSVEKLVAPEPVSINYPVQQFPEKISSLSFDKTPEISGVLLGIKGQYLIFDSGVINIRKFSSYQVSVEVN